MSRALPQSDLNIYLAKPDVSAPSQIIRHVDALRSFDVKLKGATACTLFVKDNSLNPPRWAKFFARAVPPDAFGNNSSTGAVLYIKLKASLVLVAFGQGHHLIDTANIEMDFGLKTALNMLDVVSIRSIDKSSFEEHPTQTREQTGVATELQYFGVDIERDLLRAITGKPREEKFGVRVSGKDALKLHVDVTLEGLADALEEILGVYDTDAYKRGPFAWIDHIGEVKDKSTSDKLDMELIERIKHGKDDHVWLSVPEIIDWDHVAGFKYSSAHAAPRVYDIRLSGFIDSLKGRDVSLQVLKQRSIYCVDADDQVVYERSVYRYLYAELTYQSEIFVLNNSKWYKVNRPFAEQVRGFFANVRKYQKALPAYNDETEGHYNARVVNEDGDSFVLLDKKNITVSGAASPVEPCDLFRDGNEFIHVKRYGGSSVLSHLFNQGLVSGELFQMDAEFRALLNEKLPTRFQLANPDARPGANAYHVVFAVISESEDPELSIPFFSMISLRHVVTRLQAIGFAVSFAKIAVDEQKKKTKLYAPTK